MPTFTNVTTTLKLASDGPFLKYADLLKTVAKAPLAVVDAGGVVTIPPGIRVADMQGRLDIIAACDTAGGTITLSASERTLALQLVDAYHWYVMSADVVAFRAALAVAV